MRANRYSLAESDGPENIVSTPFFSIGVTAYDRQELLKQTLLSLTEQTFSNFEVIVGNDYVQEPLSAQLLGIEDRRIRFVNNPRNMGELGNMNSLLGLSQGRYFTWIADDDLYAANFLEVDYAGLTGCNGPSCVFTSYKIIGEGTPAGDVKSYHGQEQLFTGRDFLRMYLKGKLKVIGVYGVFRSEWLRQIGGVESLCNAPIGLYGEQMLLVRSGLLEEIVYVDAPLVFYRAHEQAWGLSNRDSDQYKIAGENLVCKSLEVFKKPELQDDFQQNLLSILKVVLCNFVVRTSLRHKSVNMREVVAYLFSIKRQLTSLRGSTLYWSALASLGQAGVWVVWPFCKEKFKTVAPSSLVKVAYAIRSFFRGDVPRDVKIAKW